MKFTTSPTGFWLSRGVHRFDKGVAAAIANIVGRGCSLLDLGAGDGRYVEYWRGQDIKASGVDGNPTTWGAFLQIADLAEPLSMPIHDWVVCLEVIEHIPARFEAAVLDNIDAHNLAGAIVSWASPGQGGRGHYNERPSEYVRARFAGRGYQVDQVASTEIRRRARFSYFKRNPIVFRNLARRTAAA